MKTPNHYVTLFVLALLLVSSNSCRQAAKERPQEETMMHEDGTMHDNETMHDGEHMDDDVHADDQHMDSMGDGMTRSSLKFKDAQVTAQFQHYLHLKTALVNTDVAEAQSGARMLAEQSADSEMKSWLSSIASTTDIEQQRSLFSEVSKKMTKMVEGSLSEGEVYQQYCPMAFNNEGAYWLSTEREIRNPYFGDKMMSCGKVTATIE
ncbi:DUF3347 domain-containing protein [Croceiramulus getboli]|nr:DUF3347 domain-containing protein [Flavobacteriaceae bacterium YJPT1-3]